MGRVQSGEIPFFVEEGDGGVGEGLRIGSGEGVNWERVLALFTALYSPCPLFPPS